jgi:hypothetical protein
MRVVFLQPNYPPEMQQYTRGLAEVGVKVYGVGDSHPDSLSPLVKKALTGYLHVPRIMDEEDVLARTSAWLRGVEIDRVLANWEPLVILAARMRERWGVPGMSVDVVRGFRDKQLMKERVRAAGARGDRLPDDPQADRRRGLGRHLPHRLRRGAREGARPHRARRRGELRGVHRG